MSNVVYIPLVLAIYKIEVMFVKLLTRQQKLYNFNTFAVTIMNHRRHGNLMILVLRQGCTLIKITKNFSEV